MIVLTPGQTSLHNGRRRERLFVTAEGVCVCDGRKRAHALETEAVMHL